MEARADDRSRIGAAELGDVRPSREEALAAGQDDGTGRIGGERFGRRAQLVEHRAGQRIHLRIVEGHDGNPVVPAFDVHEISHDGDARRAAVPASSAVGRRW